MKRFTETEKWADPWFRKLSPSAKLVFLYLVDNCNNAGFCELDPEAIAFSTGVSGLEIPGAIKTLERALVGSGGWVWVKNFLRHQKNESLSDANPMHRQIIGLISDQQIRFSECSEFRPYLDPIKGLLRPIGNSKGKEEGKGKGKGESAERGNGADVDVPQCLSEIPAFSENWNGFRDQRKVKGAKMTDHAAGLILKKLSERPSEAVAALQVATIRNWTGFSWDWYDKHVGAPSASTAAQAVAADRSRTYALPENLRPKIWDPLKDPMPEE